MSIKTVTWTSATPLGCGCTDTAPVSLYLVDGLVLEASHETVEATLLHVKEVKDLCGLRHQYTFAYDDAQLVPNGRIMGADILGVVCHGAMTKYALDLVKHPYVEFTPVICGEGDLVYDGFTEFHAWYRQDRNICYVNIEVEGVVSGTPGPYLYSTLPFPPVAVRQIIYCHTYGVTSYRTPGVAFINEGKLRVSLADGGNWTVGNGRGFHAAGHYRIPMEP